MKSDNRFSFGDLFQFKRQVPHSAKGDDIGAKRQMESPGFSSTIKEIEVMCFDEDATPYATFQSHCQKVVSNDNGIFVTYIRTRNEDYMAQNWRLMWSTDNGRSFKVLYESTDATNPAPLETDEDNNIYLIYPDLMARPVELNGNSYFMIFKASDNYAKLTVTAIKKSAGDKVCMIYDKHRKQFYYFSGDGTFHVIDKNGEVKLRNHIINKIGEYDSLQYPHLSVDDNGTIHAAWTTELLPLHHYLSVQYMRSDDVGRTWKRMDGGSIELPVACGHEGDSDRIIADDEFEFVTWLASFMALNGKLHFIYKAVPHPDLKNPLWDEQLSSGRQHYIRYDIDSGVKDCEIVPDFSGKEIRIEGWDGFFAADRRSADSPLYYVSKQGNRVACLVSHDNGIRWQDYAVSREVVKNTFSMYAMGGFREITRDGHIMGTFTEVCGARTDIFAKAKAHFIKIRVDV